MTITVNKSNALLKWLPQALVIIYLVLAIFVFIAAPILASHWFRLPFVGAFLEQTLSISSVGPTSTQSDWTLQAQGYPIGSRLTDIDGIAVANGLEVQSILKDKLIGQPVVLSISSKNGQTQQIPIILSKFPSADRMAYIVIPYLVGLIYLASSLWIFYLRRRQASGQAFTVLAASIAIALVTFFDVFTTHALSNIWTLSMIMVSASIVHLALVYPSTIRLLERKPWLQNLLYLPAILIIAYMLIVLITTQRPLVHESDWRYAALYTGLAVIFFIGWMGMRRITTLSPIEREQARMILLGAIIGFGPLAVWFILTSTGQQVLFSPVLLFFLAAFPVITGYAIQRYRLLQTDLIINRISLYALMALLAAGGYALFLSGVSLILTQSSTPANPFLVGIFTFLLALAFNPIRLRLQHLIDQLFFRGNQIYEARVQTFAHELTNSTDINGILRILRDHITDPLDPSILHIYTYESAGNQFVSVPDTKNQQTSDVRFNNNSALPAMLYQRRAGIFLNSPNSTPTSLETERPRLALLGAQLFVPLPGRQQLLGWLALASRRSGQPYTSLDLHYLEALADQAAVAIERAQVMTNMENRVRELNALARVAQGVNVTITFDDILELIYAQTIQIVPTVDFIVTLYDARNDTYQQPFYLENDERIQPIERRRFSTLPTLDQEIIRSRRAILSGDYKTECQKRGLEIERPYLYAWIGVPLSSGSETIGAISLGNRNPEIAYSGEQLSLVQAIADQTAGAIVKAHLLQETEQRARQLATLNEVTRQLTSTLDTEPLLANILQNAVDMLNCEAGSLLMPDENTGELVFHVVVGPVSGDLLNQRIPPNHGIVGQCYQSRQPVIANNVTLSDTWYSSTDDKTGYHTQAAMAVPLAVKEQIIAVIEVLNRRDHQPFTTDDVAFLSAFASQASIAIENARLYTLTDQALTDRVEELSVMQRIDRQLNTSLDVNQAMKITLEWAMRQSHANAGIVGVIQDDQFHIMAIQGYTTELENLEDQIIPLSQIPAQEAILNGSLQQVFITPESGSATLLLNGQSQVVMPLQRETATIGILLLESLTSEALTPDTLTFLTRLGDHASIAISNAQLYTAVQAANLAKSEFVSIVAHELKNPMTSIKGYTDLLAAGAVGPVNENQANFLSTIRSNIDRMNTLVSDLNDLSKIEAGRMRLDFKPQAATQLVDESVRGLKRQIDEKGQTMELQIPASLPNVWVDRNRVIQVLVNLISNAHKYTPQNGKITISAELADNTWDATGATRVVHIAVHDTGIGMTPEDQKKVFQKFFRSEDPKTREAPGTGLGLNITRSLVELQGGKIWFESEFRAGSTFHFTLPIAE